MVSSDAGLSVLPVEMPSVIAGPLVNPANGHEYYLLEQSTWVEAEARARALGGHLATLRSAAEQEWVFTQFSTWGSQERNLWIGLHDADPVNNATDSVDRRAEFVWASGEPVTYANWSVGEPNNYREMGEYYVNTLSPSDPTGAGTWNDTWDMDFNQKPLHGVVEVPRVIEPAVILVQPRPRTNVVGSSLMLSVTATGVEPLAYQWFKDGLILPGATGRRHVLTSVQPSDAGAYSVRVGDFASSAISSNALLSVVPAQVPSVIAGPLINPANGYAYYLLGQSTWVEAEAAAQALGGHLATLRSAVEQEWVFTQFSTWGGQERNLWIGLHDADPVNNPTNSVDRRAEFVWASGEPVTYANWSVGEPNNYREMGEYYVNTLSPSDPTGAGTWNDTWDTDFNGKPLHGVVEVAVRRITALVRTADGQFQFTVSGSLGDVYQIEASTNLVHWQIIGTITNTGGMAEFRDTEAGSFRHRFYRFVVP